MDYQELINNLEPDKIIQLMTSLGADRYVEKDNYIQFPTICHNEISSEASLKLYYYKDSHLFYCYTNCANMSIFDFLKNYYETRGISYSWGDLVKTVKECSNYVEGGRSYEVYHSERDKYVKTELKRPPYYDSAVLETFTKYYTPEWLSDGISKEAMDKYNILYSISQNKIIIPHYDAVGRLVGIRGRALNKWEEEQFGKYMPVYIENVLYRHELSLNLYGLYQNKGNIRKYGTCFIFESEKSVL